MSNSRGFDAVQLSELNNTLVIQDTNYLNSNVWNLDFRYLTTSAVLDNHVYIFRSYTSNIDMVRGFYGHFGNQLGRIYLFSILP